MLVCSAFKSATNHVYGLVPLDGREGVTAIGAGAGAAGAGADTTAVLLTLV